MLTVSIKSSAKTSCKPLSVNKLLTHISCDTSVFDRFWPGLVRDKTINSGKKTSVKLSKENLDFLKNLKKHIRREYDLFVSYSMLVCVLLKIYERHDERRVISLNVKGYKAPSADFKRRIEAISKRILEELPDIVFLQEFRVGDGDAFLKILIKDLKRYYDLILPKNYTEADCSNCICISLVGKNNNQSKSFKFKDEGDYKLRYNMLKVGDYTFLNAWMPQIYSDREKKLDYAEGMWEKVSEIVDHYHGRNEKFCLIGDLNAYVGGPFENKILKLSYLMSDTKAMEDMYKATGPGNVLDYAFINRFAKETNTVRTTVLRPSIKRAELSDHEALLMNIRPLA